MVGKPKFMLQYEQKVQELELQAPRSCWACCEFNERTSHCYRHEQKVPDEFRDSSPNECEAWSREAF